jgi:hypothetical protein
LDRDVGGKITGITAGTVTVNSGAKIQQGIDLASGGGGVNVNAGTYTDNLDQSFYSRNVNLAGSGNPTTSSITLDRDVGGKITGITAGTVTVNSGAKIQQGIDLASDGGRVNVNAGTYNEIVDINKDLTLKGSGDPRANRFSLTNSALLGTGSGGITAPIVDVNERSKIQDGILLAAHDGTVNVNAGTYTENIAIGKQITVKGAGSASTTVNGGGIGTVFTISSGADVDISGLKFTNGKGDNGGGIYNQGTATLTDCEISGNIANRGGGIYNQGTVTISGGAIGSGNTANQGDAVNDANNRGGGIYNQGTATLTDCKISGSTAGNRGGGIYNQGTATLTDCTISGNTAGNRGGGIYNEATVTLTDCTISGSTAGNRGGGIYNQGTASTATLTDCTISGNTAGNRGGGIYNEGTATVSGGTISGNNPDNIAP